MGGETISMKALVTGGGGFLGGAIVRALRARGDHVKALQRGQYPALEAADVEVHSGDIADKDSVINASAGCDVIFHVAAKAGVWGDYRDYYRTNVTGTGNVIAACRQNKIRRLVYTSSPSVVFDGKDERQLDETAPYPVKFLNHYQATKAQAERMVLAANDASLATVALRPHLIFGPGDPHLVPRIINRARQGKLRLVGQCRNPVDITYIDNAVAAHLLACDALSPGSACAGKAYFISNGEPLFMRDIINRILQAAHLPAVTKTVPPSVAYVTGALLEFIYAVFSLRNEPVMTRFIARQLACAHWYDINAARRDFNYQPLVSIERGMRQLEQALSGKVDATME